MRQNGAYRLIRTAHCTKRECPGIVPENNDYLTASAQISANSSNSDTTCQKRSGLRS
jgi:hypothetical protein